MLKKHVPAGSSPKFCYHCPSKIFAMKKLFSTRCSDGAFSFAMLVLRLGVGFLMLVNHGLDKLMHFAEKAPRFADPIGFGSTTSLSMAVFAEFFCSVFIILGLFTRLAVIPLIITMGAALFYAHKGQLFGEGEYAALYLTAYITLLFTGPGSASLDKFIGK
jgi:putative oxidoreductase